MNEKIASLIRLQEMDKELDALRASVDRLSPERESLKAQIAASAARFDAGKKSLTDAQVQKKNLEIEIDTQDQQVRKHSGQLNSVKSNDAYKALLLEIEAAKKQKSDLEDQVLVLMETIEKLQKQSKEDDVAAQRERADLEKKIAALDAEEAQGRAAVAAKTAERDAFAAAAPADARSRYESVQRGRPGFVVVVPVNGMTCGGCRTLLTADTVNQAMKGKEIVACDSCSRLLFIVPKPAVAS
ncbi:MAG TPA: C4-type zinc ribbon domain-containing protein [Elusimicrobiota bacterium]|nr:C4-type zinc ribbon domain-containing protein [Elusimicrobiota bacterium]HNG44878.1 C4-type zinc ribbon domain-containing protein [Elusimicrobiota bacterium]